MARNDLDADGTGLIMSRRHQHLAGNAIVMPIGDADLASMFSKWASLTTIFRSTCT